MEIKIYHAINGAQFEDLIADLFNAKENTNTYIVAGRSGQYQGGVDIYSAEKRTAIECKYRSGKQSVAKTRSELKAELSGTISDLVFLEKVTFTHFILVSTFSHDKVLQDYANELQRKENYPFTISYIGWDEIQKWLFQFPHILNRYFGNIHGARVELVSINMDSANCSWIPIPKSTNAFEDIESEKSPYPIFDFTFVNHFSKTIVLKAIRIRLKGLNSGLSGLPHAYTLNPICKYVINYDYELGENVLLADPPIAIPPGEPFRFQVQVTVKYFGKLLAPERRKIVYFAFDFNSDITVLAPDILLNTTNENDYAGRTLRMG